MTVFKYFDKTNRDSILKLTSLALSLWPNCLEKKPNRIANENKRSSMYLSTLKTFAKDYGAKKDVFIVFSIRPNTLWVLKMQ